tara:strand:- start:289 stop:936 length:648 start_codon:yes stop_codon:yes gene_type:complete
VRGQERRRGEHNKGVGGERKPLPAADLNLGDDDDDNLIESRMMKGRKEEEERGREGKEEEERGREGREEEERGREGKERKERNAIEDRATVAHYEGNEKMEERRGQKSGDGEVVMKDKVEEMKIATDVVTSGKTTVDQEEEEEEEEEEKKKKKEKEDEREEEKEAGNGKVIGTEAEREREREKDEKVLQTLREAFVTTNGYMYKQFKVRWGRMDI